MDMGKLNIVSLVLMIVMIIITLPLYPKNILIEFSSINILVFFSVYIIWMFLHEILHSIAYIILIKGGALNKGIA